MRRNGLFIGAALFLLFCVAAALIVRATSSDETGEAEKAPVTIAATAGPAAEHPAAPPKGTLSATDAPAPSDNAHLARQRSDAAVPPNDPMLDGMLPDDAQSPAHLHALVQREARDEAWATKAEASLKDRYRSIPYVGGANNPLRITCASTLCEVAGQTPEGLSEPNMNLVVKALQERAFIDSLAASGLHSQTMIFGSSRDRPDQTRFVGYFRRSAGPKD